MAESKAEGGKKEKKVVQEEVVVQQGDQVTFGTIIKILGRTGSRL